MIDLDAIDAAHEKATAGPWVADTGPSIAGSLRTFGIMPKHRGFWIAKCQDIILYEDPNGKDNADFIVLLRNSWPAIRDRIRELERENARNYGRLRRDRNDQIRTHPPGTCLRQHLPVDQ